MTHRLRGHGKSALILVTGVFLGSLATCTHTTSSPAPESTSSAVSTVTQLFAPSPAFAAASGSGDVTLADVAERAVPSVVSISTVRKVTGGSRSPMLRDPMFREFFGPMPPPGDREAPGLGSGVIVSADGLVLTNNHVVDKATELTVTLSDGREFDAEVLGTDPKSDLAVIQLDGATGLAPLPFGDSSALRLGEVVLAVGNPLGVGQTVTMGIVSAKGRSSVGIVDYEDFIQTDAAINPGNSGGALINMRGELVGVNTAILSRSGGYQGIGFAIPSDMVQPILSSLVTDGKVSRGFLGVGIQTVDRDLAAALELGKTRGVLISDVQQGSPAAKAGIERGDVVVAVDGTKVTTSAQLRNLVASKKPGTTVSIALLRDGAERTVSAVLDALASRSPGGQSGQAETDEGALAGMTVTELSPELRQRLEVPASVRGGVVVTAVDPGSPAARAGVRRGDVLVEIDRKRIDSVEEFERLEKRAGDTMALLVYRDGSTAYIALRR